MRTYALLFGLALGSLALPACSSDTQSTVAPTSAATRTVEPSAPVGEQAWNLQHDSNFTGKTGSPMYRIRSGTVVVTPESISVEGTNAGGTTVHVNVKRTGETGGTVTYDEDGTAHGPFTVRKIVVVAPTSTDSGSVSFEGVGLLKLTCKLITLPLTAPGS